MNEKFNKNAKVEKLTKKVGRGVRLIVIGPFEMTKNGASEWAKNIFRIPRSFFQLFILIFSAFVFGSLVYRTVELRCVTLHTICYVCAFRMFPLQKFAYLEFEYNLLTS